MLLCRCGLLFLLLTIWARGQEQALIRVGENWKYFKGEREPSSQPGAWRQPEFNDTSWFTGISGFSHGYGGEYGEPTELDDFGTTYGSVYFRKSFAVTNLTRVKWLTLRIDYNDGFVAY